jgi:DMSO reductase anchor subunit
VHALGAAPVPFANASGSVYLALPLAGVVGYATDGGVQPIAQIQANIAAAAIAANATAAVYGDLGEVYEALSSVLQWNTCYSPYEGVVTPVSRGWDFGAGYVLFDWDNLFLVRALRVLRVLGVRCARAASLLLA